MYRIIALLIGYAIGCIQTAYIVGRIKGIDIRDHGSKNAGMTNVTRILGKKAGAFVFVVDVLKGVAAFALAAWLYQNEGMGILPGLYAGLGAVLGHCFPFFLKFRGGKGVSCALGVILMFDWRVALIAYALGFIAVCATRYISLASLVITLAAAVLAVIFGHLIEGIALMFALAALIWILHRGNIKLILTRKERKFLEKKK